MQRRRSTSWNKVTLLRVAQDVKRSMVCLLAVLNTDCPVYNLNDYKYLKLYYKTSLKHYGKVYRQLLKCFGVTLCFCKQFFSGSNALYTFWVYMDGINQTKGPIVIFMGHIGVPTKEARQR